MFMPSGLYTSPTALAAAFTAKQEQQSAASAVLSSPTTRMSPMAYSAAEKKIQLYSGVR